MTLKRLIKTCQISHQDKIPACSYQLLPMHQVKRYEEEERRTLCLKIKYSREKGSIHRAIMFWFILNRNHCNQIVMSRNCTATVPPHILLISCILVHIKKTQKPTTVLLKENKTKNLAMRLGHKKD